MKTHTTKAHFEKYANMAKEAHTKITDLELFGVKNETHLLKLFKEDENLNNIPLKRFDIFFHWWKGKREGPKSLAENTCMYKHLLIYQVLGVKPVFDN